MPRVLIVDDEDIMRMLLRRMLQTMKCEVAEAPNGIEAEKLFSTVNPDLILLDIMMPLQDGYETCTHLRQCGYKGMIIMCSALQEKRESTRTDAAGANGFIQKPCTKEAIAPFLEKLVSSQPAV